VPAAVTRITPFPGDGVAAAGPRGVELTLVAKGCGVPGGAILCGDCMVLLGVMNIGVTPGRTPKPDGVAGGGPAGVPEAPKPRNPDGVMGTLGGGPAGVPEAAYPP